MAIKYEVDGNIFREINEKWPFAYVSEYLIKARQFQIDQAGNKVEVFQLNDGRIFSRPVPEHVRSAARRDTNTQPRIPYPATESG